MHIQDTKQESQQNLKKKQRNCNFFLRKQLFYFEAKNYLFFLNKKVLKKIVFYINLALNKAMIWNQ